MGDIAPSVYPYHKTLFLQILRMIRKDTTAIYEIISHRKYEGHTGIYHYSNEGVTSWYDFTQMIARIAGHTECDILPCYSSEYPSPVKRPSYSVLDKQTFKETFGVQVPYWVDSLEKCVNNLKQQTK